MKNYLTFVMLFLMLLFLNSCMQEPLYDLKADGQSHTVERDIFAAIDIDIKTQLCEFSLNDLDEGERLSINCIVDLKGEKITLAKDVKLSFDGGDIVNGALIFNGGHIAGELLNKTLEIEGDAMLINPSFSFNKSRWDIVEGKTDNSTAFSNRINLENLIKTVKDLDGNKMLIDDLDAFFELTKISDPKRRNFDPSREAINIPSDFTLQMTGRTHLRVFPNNFKKTSLMAVRDANNVQIIGGTLHGDRDEHDYSAGGTHEWGHLIDLKGATNTKISGVTLINATGDGLVIHSIGMSFQDHYRPSHTITIENCIIDSSRRNNMSITDGYDIVVENNKFYRAGINTEKSKGTNPRYALDVEPYYEIRNGKFKYYEKVDNIIIRNNIEKDGGRGGFIIASGDNVIIENNEVEDGIAYKHTSNSIIRNNVLKSGKSGKGTGISAGVGISSVMNNNQVYGNKIEGYSAGISISGNGHLIRNNQIDNCYAGINGKNISNTDVLENVITSNNPNDRGIFIHYTSINRVLFKDNIINVPSNPFKFELVNTGDGEEKYCAHLVDNIFDGKRPGLLRNSVGVSLMKNTINTGIQVWDSKNFVIENNKIKSSSMDGIYLIKENENVKLMENIINVPDNKMCVKIQKSTSQEEIDEINNKCVD